MGYLLIFGVFMLISWAVGARLKSRFREYSKIPVNYGLSGREIAEKMLRESGVDDVQVVSVQGELSDHYNPMTKTVNLSPDVYHGRSISAAAVAAHECGHAVQHATAYAWLMMRSKLVPVVSFASNWVQWVLLAGILLVNTFPGLLLAGIVLFALTTLFSFITLPVELDASRRAIAWLDGSGIASPATLPKAQEALRLAAYTYVVAALASLATLLYYIMIYMGRRD
ncbi:MULTISPECIES: zinc metallopeptidase [Lentimicrobium]|jgi:Zn-dependent membrane protease YugP|uniref:Zn-dependent membrane protease YugP n=1 Tax=Lentimicrobium saccharophilum TaxID=1678841 RepID=A0A0S7BYL0_9BACT|nr:MULTISPECIES: zinc metallopeptidase [Lentimicrobium]MCO5258285.1 zinc metallopeptidase [Lentimicrobium sp.]MCO5261954.1 zinc metallopeptidase [Lentimicrobium sp.]GAP43659.1 Zn-dependent membrane protease YugP [Lentimicrobium saccharophilum]HPF63852.1 zinc metallopeptidase [Lentimicrobium sp.]HPJ63049.1 zinc metallopeptidase [Lentimicrobium sp.]